MFYKQRDNLFYPTWAFVVPTSMLRLPYSLGEAIIWSGIVYYIVGLAPRRRQVRASCRARPIVVRALAPAWQLQARTRLWSVMALRRCVATS